MSDEKKCPVDRGKLLIGLECCRMGDIKICRSCPYNPDAHDYLTFDTQIYMDALAYINYLEERLGVTG